MIYLANILTRIACDANPAEAGFQPSGLYIAICLILPIIMGVLAALLSTLVMKIFHWRRLKQEVTGDF